MTVINPVNAARQKMASFLTELLWKEIATMSPQKTETGEWCGIESSDVVITEEVERVCNAATLGEIAKVSLLVRRLKKSAKSEKEKIANRLIATVKRVIKRAEDRNGPLKLSEVCLRLLSEL